MKKYVVKCDTMNRLELYDKVHSNKPIAEFFLYYSDDTAEEYEKELALFKFSKSDDPLLRFYTYLQREKYISWLVEHQQYVTDFQTQHEYDLKKGYRCDAALPADVSDVEYCYESHTDNEVFATYVTFNDESMAVLFRLSCVGESE